MAKSHSIKQYPEEFSPMWRWHMHAFHPQGTHTNVRSTDGGAAYFLVAFSNSLYSSRFFCTSSSNNANSLRCFWQSCAPITQEAETTQNPTLNEGRPDANKNSKHATNIKSIFHSPTLSRTYAYTLSLKSAKRYTDIHLHENTHKQIQTSSEHNH